jgi:hypothetical protein
LTFIPQIHEYELVENNEALNRTSMLSMVQIKEDNRPQDWPEKKPCCRADHTPLYSILIQLSSAQLRFQVLTVTSMKMTVFWDVAPCDLVEVYRRFKGACCLHHQDDDE